MANIAELLKSVGKKYNFLAEFIQDNKKLSKIYLDDIRPYLADRGWYIAGSLYPEQYLELRKAIQDKNEVEIEGLLKQHIRNSIVDIEIKACNSWPSREAIILDAFEAHKNCKYSLSIPVMLAQADGMSHDILGANLFTKYNGDVKKEVKKLIDFGKVDTSLAIAFLDLLTKPSSLMINTNIRDKSKKNDLYFGPCNRHGILHGIDLDYPTESNGLRAISLISFLVWLNDRVSK